MSKGESHVSIGTGMSETDTTKNSSDKSGMSNSDELLSTNSSVVDSATGNVRSAQEIVDKYLQSQKDLARRFKKKHPDTKVDTNDSAQKSVNEMNDRSSGQSKCKDKRRQYNTEWKKRARTQSEFRERETQVNRTSKKMAREDPAFRDDERERNTKCMRMARRDLMYRDNERECDRKSKQMVRRDETYRDSERDSNRNSMQVARKERSKQLSLDDLIKNFHQEVAKGPVHKCCVCEQLWYRHSVTKLKSKGLPDCHAVDMCVSDMPRSGENKLICNI